VHTAAHGGWFSYDNYEDCMLGRMKGQSQTMYSTADKACKREFGIEFDLYRPNVKWEFRGAASENYAEISIMSASNGTDEYEITSGEFVFSSKSCDGLTEAEFGKPVQLRFIKGKAQVPFGLIGSQCARALSFTGKYK
jgi:hypothetical protein